MSPRNIAKRCAQAVCLAAVFPAVVLCGFGRVETAYTLFAHFYALSPGIVGDYLRAAFYRLTLRECSQNVVIAFGSFFSRRDACVAPHVSIGSYCVIGRVRIGERTQIASHVEIPSGRHQHIREEGRLSAAIDDELVIGPRCWIGASAVVLANVGADSTIGAGSVVVKDIPDGVVAVGNPARAIKSAGTSVEQS